MLWSGGPQTPAQKPAKLKEIYCSPCNNARRVENSRLVAITGFSAIKCSGGKCFVVQPRYKWNCRCLVPWIKCPRHVHIASIKNTRPIKEVPERKKMQAIYGTDKPRPVPKPTVKLKTKNSERLRKINVDEEGGEIPTNKE